MSKDILVSVIVPIYNAEKHIKKCIESVMKQSYKNFELILVDDGSTDNSECICKRIKDSRIKYIFKENGGVSSARNEGIRNANGKYIFFLDADDYLDSNSLISLIENQNDNNLPSLPIRTVKYNTTTENFVTSQSIDINIFTEKIINGKIGGFCWGYLFETKIVKQIEFNEKIKFMEDTLFLFEYLKNRNIQEITIPINNNYYNYIINPNSATNRKSNVIGKINDMFFVLDKIKKTNNNKYNDIIEYKKIRLLEAEMRLLTSNDDYKLFFNEIKLQKKSSMNLRYNVFYFLYKNKIIFGLKFYYLIRKIAKGGI